MFCFHYYHLNIFYKAIYKTQQKTCFQFPYMAFPVITQGKLKAGIFVCRRNRPSDERRLLWKTINEKKNDTWTVLRSPIKHYVVNNEVLYYKNIIETMCYHHGCDSRSIIRKTDLTISICWCHTASWQSYAWRINL